MTTVVIVTAFDDAQRVRGNFEFRRGERRLTDRARSRSQREMRELASTLEITIDERHAPGDAFDVCVANATTGFKYAEARQLRKPIVTAEWLRASARAKRLVAMDRYKVRPLLGCEVCITGFTDLDTRERLQRTVEENGGKYSPDLVANRCTHLIAAKPEGKKYEVARDEAASGRSQIKIVTEKWLDDCVRLEEKLDESKYPVIERVVATPQVSKWMPPPLIADDTPWDSHFLFGCRIYMVGYDAHERETKREMKNLMHQDSFEAMKAVRLGAGILTKDLNKATHVVCSKYANDEDFYRVRMAKDRCIIGKWLLTCAREGQCVPLESYLVLDKVWENVTKRMTTARAESASVSGTSGGNRDAVEEPSRENRTSRLNPAVVTAQEVREPQFVTREQNPLTRENLGRSHVPETHNTLGTELPATELVRCDDQDELADPSKLSVPFADKRIALSVLLAEDEASAARLSISKGGGQVIDLRTGKEFMTADYMVCPSMPGSEERRAISKMAMAKTQLVTCFWLEECLAHGSIIDVTNSVVYQPLSCDLPCMRGVSLSASQYSERVKSVIRYSCVLVDAKYSDRLTRQRHTHLITPFASGEKYLAASKWGLQVVTVEWLEACIKNGKHLDESEFRPKAQLEQNSSGPEKTFKPQVVGKDLSALLQTSEAHVPSPKSISKSTPSMDSKMRKSADARGKTPLSRKSSGVTPGSKRTKTLNGYVNAEDQNKNLFNEIMESMEKADNRAQDFPAPTNFPTARSPVHNRATNRTGISSLQLTQNDRHETQVGYADFKVGSPRKSPAQRPDGADKLNTLFAATTNAANVKTIQSQGDNPSEWMM